jgi:hypothetical protein
MTDKLPSKYQIGDRVTHSDPSWSNPGVPATIHSVTLRDTGDTAYGLRYDRPSESGVISTDRIEEAYLIRYEEEA